MPFVPAPRTPARLRRSARYLGMALVTVLGVTVVAVAGDDTPAPASQAATSTRTLTAAADAVTRAGAPTAKGGTAKTLRVDGAPVVRSFLRFSLGTAGPVQRATLLVHADLGRPGRRQPQPGHDHHPRGRRQRPRLELVTGTGEEPGGGTEPPPPGGTSDWQPTAPIRAGFYFPWFPEAWRQQGKDPFAVDQPSAGYYDSSSPEVIAGHIEAMRYGGMQAAISSWWGRGTRSDQRFPQLLAAAAGKPFRWAVFSYSSVMTGQVAFDQLGLASGLPGDDGSAGDDQAEQEQDEQTTHEAPLR